MCSADPLKKVSESIIELIVWFFFVIIYAYYGGALTMFFTNEPTLPFKTVTDALNIVPEWRVLLIKSGGGNFNFKEKARQVNIFLLFFILHLTLLKPYRQETITWHKV